MENKTIVVATTIAHHLFDSILNSSSSEEDDVADNRHVVLAGLVLPESHPKQTGYLKVISSYSNSDFWRHFRVTRATFGLILGIFTRENFRTAVYHGGCEPMAHSEMLFITLQYLGNQGAIRLLADKFNRSESSVWAAIDFICQFFYDHQSEFICFPKKNEVRRIAATFQEKSNFPGVVSAVDGCHIPFQAPSNAEIAYRNFKKFHSFVLMAAVLPDRKFSYIFTGYPGSSHDSYVFQRSSLFKNLEENCADHFDQKRYHLVGDSAFVLKPWLLSPYKRSPTGLTQSQKRFNYKLSSTRIVVENSFGDLKNRFRRTQKINATISKAVNIVTTCCVIHNICITNGDLNIEPHVATLHCHVNPPICGLVGDNAGAHKRDAIMRRFMPDRNVHNAFRHN